MMDSLFSSYINSIGNMIEFIIVNNVKGGSCMGKKYLDEVVDRSGTCSVKWDPEFLKEEFGRGDLLPMWVADMDFKCPESVIKAIENRVAHGIFGYSYRDNDYIDSIINWNKKRHNWDIKKEWILFTPGIVSALNHIIQTFCNPGDKVIIQRPVYYPFTDAIENNGCKVLNNELRYDGSKYIMDLKDLEKCAKDPYAKLLILCNPHNPVGRVWTRDELKKMGDICIENNVLIVCDEIHSDLILKSHTHIPIQEISEELKENSIVCTAPSKTFNLAGLQTSNIIIPNERIRAELHQHLLRNAVEMTNTFGVVGLTAAYNHGEDWLEDVLEYLEENVELIDTFVKEKMPLVGFVKPEGTYLGWLDFRNVVSNEKELDDLLINKAKVALDGGYWFGPEGIGFARINYACPKATLIEGLNRIATAIDNLRGD